MAPDERWVGVEEVATHLQVGKDSVYRWVEAKGLPARRVGRLLRFRLSEVDDWVEAGGGGNASGSESQLGTNASSPKTRGSRLVTEQRTAPESSFGKLSDETVAEIVARVLDACLPERMILFGSAATGRMTRDSDIDILVVLNHVADARREAMRVRTALADLPFPFDVIVMTQDRFEETRDVIGGIAWPAARYGRVIYEAA